MIYGEPGRTVRLVVATTGLARPNDVLSFVITSDYCAFSSDGGTTWTPFAAGALSQEVQFPDDVSANNSAAILVRVGGTIIASEGQRRGEYSGNILLDATYLDLEDGSNLPVSARSVAKLPPVNAVRGNFVPPIGVILQREK
jgi:hypothetical protein